MHRVCIRVHCRSWCYCRCRWCYRCRRYILFSDFEIMHLLSIKHVYVCLSGGDFDKDDVYVYSFPVIYSCWRDANWHKQTTIVARRTDKHQIVFELKACTSHVLKHQMSKADRKWTMMQTQMHRITKERWWKWSKMNTHINGMTHLVKFVFPMQNAHRTSHMHFYQRTKNMESWKRLPYEATKIVYKTS